MGMPDWLRQVAQMLRGTNRRQREEEAEGDDGPRTKGHKITRPLMQPQTQELQAEIEIDAEMKETMLIMMKRLIINTRKLREGWAPSYDTYCLEVKAKSVVATLEAGAAYMVAAKMKGKGHDLGPLMGTFWYLVKQVETKVGTLTRKEWEQLQAQKKEHESWDWVCYVGRAKCHDGMQILMAMPNPQLRKLLRECLETIGTQMTIGQAPEGQWELGVFADMLK